ncbi:helix-turn-helix domain-containing protein [Enterococcus pingfangensis]
MIYLSKYNQLKIEIIEILSQINQEISYKDLLSKLSKGLGIHSLISLCKELETDISKVYPEKNVYLKINSSSLQLIRYSSTLLYLYDEIFSSDLSYKIIESLFYKRSFNSEKFCHEQGISLSTFRRKIADLNKYLSHYQLHISVSSRLTLQKEQGSKNGEISARFYLFSFLYSIHRQIQNVHWIQNSDKLKELRDQIFTYLGISYSGVPNDTVLLWLYVIQVSALNKHTLDFTNEEQRFIDALDFPRKPNFLTTWTAEDWQFLIVILYSFDNFNYQLNDSLTLPPQEEEKIQKIESSWFENFETAFQELSPEQQTISHKYFQKKYLFQQFFPVNEVTTQQLTFLDISAFHKNYPLYYQKFQKLWQNFSLSITKREIDLYYFEVEAILLSTYLCPPVHCLPNFKLFLLSDLGHFYESYIRTQITDTVRGLVDLTFVDNPIDADLTVSLIPPPAALGIPNGTVFLLKMPLNEWDLADLFLKIKSLIDTQYPRKEDDRLTPQLAEKECL